MVLASACPGCVCPCARPFGRFFVVRPPALSPIRTPLTEFSRLLCLPFMWLPFHTLDPSFARSPAVALACAHATVRPSFCRNGSVVDLVCLESHSPSCQGHSKKFQNDWSKSKNARVKGSAALYLVNAVMRTETNLVVFARCRFRLALFTQYVLR